MIAQDDAQILLEGLNYLTENPKATVWKGTSRISFLGSLSEIFLTDDINQIRKDLQMLSSGQVSSNTTPQDVIERAVKQGITKENLEVRVQEQRSQVKYWVNKIKERTAAQKIAEKEIKSTESAKTAEKETTPKPQPEKVQKETAKPKARETVIKENIQPKEEVIPITDKESVENQVSVDEKLENIQITFDTKETGSVQERLDASQPFYVASLKSKESEFIDLNPSLNLISKGVSSEALNNASNSLPEGPEKHTIQRISLTMEKIERIFPDEISRFRNFVSVENLEIQIAKTDFNPSSNNIFLSSNQQGGYSISDGSSYIDSIASFAKDKVLNKASDAVLSKVKTEVGGKLAKSAIGKAVSSFGKKIAGTAIGKAIGAIGGKIATAIAAIGGPLAWLIGLVANAVMGWLTEKLLPLLNKIKDWIKNAAAGTATAAITIISIPFIYVASSFITTLLIVLIVLPISVAVIMFIINSGAYVVPPNESIFKSENAFVEVIKDAEPSGPFENSSLPLKIKYTISIRAKKEQLTNLRFSHICKVVNKNSQTDCDSPLPQDKPESISAASPYVFMYETTYSGNAYQDSLVINTFTVTADSTSTKNENTSGSASIIIGEAPTQCLTLSGNWPGGYKANMETAIAHLASGYGNFLAKVCSGGDLALKYNPDSVAYWGYYHGTYIDFYKGGLVTEREAKYILAHELAHALADRIPSIYMRYLSTSGITSETPRCLYSYDSSLLEERFAESVAFYAANPCSFLLQNKYPIHYRFVKENVFK